VLRDTVLAWNAKRAIGRAEREIGIGCVICRGGSAISHKRRGELCLVLKSQFGISNSATLAPHLKQQIRLASARGAADGLIQALVDARKAPQDPPPASPSPDESAKCDLPSAPQVHALR
jgi:hypothetical protein